LRALETGELERLGGTRTAKVDVRLIAATNKDLAAEVKSGEFREDLYFRLNVLPVSVPPLRERKADVARLAQHFLARFTEAEGRGAMALADDAKELLEEYHWPGNVREMRNLMERAVVLVSGDTITAADLNPWLESPPDEGEDAGLKGKVARSEIESIRRALDAADWNVTQAAAGLGIDRTNLHRKMRKYGIARR
jgi:two-component system nitrogen regulation response regulator NtrX